MIISYSKNILVQIAGIIANNFWRIFFFTIAASIAHILHVELGYEGVKLPVMPVTLLGGALAIFLGFRNSSAYDRWWEARKVWGEIVNRSRSLAMQILTYSSSSESEMAQLKAWQKAMIYRHIGWVYALKTHLHSSPQNLTNSTWFTPSDIKSLAGKTNIPAQILAIQGQEIKGAFESKWIEDFRQYELIHTIENLYDCQGKCERINSEEYGKKEYISSKDILSVRQHYRTRFGLQNFAGNYSHDNRFAKTSWLCRCLESREKESHLTSGKCLVFEI